MMGKTHLMTGIAASLLVMQPKTFEECILALVGGSVGGILADNDILDNDSHDSFATQRLAFSLAGGLLLMDFLFRLGTCHSIFQNGYLMPSIGLGLFVILFVLGILSKHRTFTHSITALVLYTGSVALIYLPFTLPFAIGYASHLLLDFLNKKKLPLFYPMKKGFCLRVCYANKLGNQICMILSSVITCIMLMISLFYSIWAII